MERWHTTFDTKEAAAFAALGTEVRIMCSTFERTSSTDVRFLVGPASACRKWNTGTLRKALRQGTLPSTDPGHPLLVFLRAYTNRARRLSSLRDGGFFRPVPIPSVPGFHQLESSPSGLPGLDAGTPAVRTVDLKLSAALETSGFPCIHIRGSRGAEEFYHAAVRPQNPPPFHDASYLVSEWRRDRQALPWELLFTQAMHGLEVHQRLLEEVKRSKHTIVLSKGLTTHALVREDAGKNAWDKAKVFLGGAR